MIDKIDIKIIELLQNNSRISVTSISSLINLSRPSVNERILRLIEKGVLKKFTTYVPPESVGRKVSFFIQIENLKVPYQKVVDFLSSKDCVTEVHAVSGNANYIVKASTESIEEMNELLCELMFYGKIVTSIILNSPVLNRAVKPITGENIH